MVFKGFLDSAPNVSIHAKRSSSTPVGYPGENHNFLHYIHPTEAGFSRNKTRARSLIEERQHQRERPFAPEKETTSGKRHIGGDWPQLDSASRLPAIKPPTCTTWLNETRISTVVTVDDLIAACNLESQQCRVRIVEEKMIESCRIAFEKGYPSTLPVLDDLVGIFISKGQGPDAARLGREVFKMCLSSLGEGHHHTLTAMDNLAATYGIMGRSSEQRRLKKKIVRIRAKWLGEDHEDTVATRDQLIRSRVGNADVRKVEMRWKGLVGHFGIKLAGESRTPRS